MRYTIRQAGFSAHYGAPDHTYALDLLPGWSLWQARQLGEVCYAAAEGDAPPPAFVPREDADGCAYLSPLTWERAAVESSVSDRCDCSLLLPLRRSAAGRASWHFRLIAGWVGAGADIWPVEVRELNPPPPHPWATLLGEECADAR